MQLWKYDFEKREVRLVECPKGRWPACDAEGEPVCTNTHFDNEDAAWEKLERELEASMELDARERKRLIQAIECVIENFADAAQGLVEVRAKREKRDRERGLAKSTEPCEG